MSNGAKCVKILFLVKYLSSIKINTLVIVIKRGSQESGGRNPNDYSSEEGGGGVAHVSGLPN
ncbi:hypothetical protein DN756_12480 [Yersinia pseudotuberculosis]|nr:hypothetical protein EGX87_15360 [Yersinia pseudotuberculosis]AYW99191.1 hypothetical protein EGX53_04505 [Yersinia pseudotuberculosis]AZA30753.1 hypothetical protein DN756_12480 [Yersinia pseudotuberculosis]